MERNRGVGRAGSPADRQQTGSAGQLGVRDGHHPGAALMPADDRLNPGIVAQSVEKRQVGFTRNAENPVRTEGLETVHEMIRSAHCFAGHTFLP
jgi:hypothetical protein